MMRYRIVNLGQVKPPPCPEVPEAEGLNCQRTPEGGVLCSDGSYYPPGCPSPKITTPGTTTYVREAGQVKLATPPSYSLARDTGTEFPWLLVGIAAAGIVVAVVF